jgi:hypothetical protein
MGLNIADRFCTSSYRVSSTMQLLHQQSRNGCPGRSLFSLGAWVKTMDGECRISRE